MPWSNDFIARGTAVGIMKASGRSPDCIAGAEYEFLRLRALYGWGGVRPAEDALLLEEIARRQAEVDALRPAVAPISREDYGHLLDG
jgi:hypothetical protein